MINFDNVHLNLALNKVNPCTQISAVNFTDLNIYTNRFQEEGAKLFNLTWQEASNMVNHASDMDKLIYISVIFLRRSLGKSAKRIHGVSSLAMSGGYWRDTKLRFVASP